ncbi:predicted protein [Nematostella vectensis]|uniref:AN1-type domain-containing protein n=1 Tax=Nematostella vectensis TaxID=45351 RepID=A7SGU5_NEMVE|nr:predicted protein [Nematostella vectensis]|eukprot:XP_001629134.1 predicted protein [Nematostella vectensis]
MAELPALGDHCEVLSCKLLDFLPFICSDCTKTFCKDHRTKDAHSCPSLDNNEGCTEKELLPVKCEHCQLIFCMRHRHQSDHRCGHLMQAPVRIDPVQRVQEITVKIGVKNESRAAKVALMKLKMKAEGDKSIPQDERVYFNICLPKDGQERQKGMFFSKVWTIGKAVDKTASIIGLKNQNNVATAKKLCLFDSNSGEVLDMSDSFQDLMCKENSSVVSGGSLILEYVANDCYRIQQPEEYLT